MKYFITNNERVGTCYHEFYKGKWDGHTFWKEDSLLLDDDILGEHRDFIKAIAEVIPTYDPYNVIEISSEAWEAIGQVIQDKDTSAQELYQEVDEWLKGVLEENGCFTILGI